MATKTNDMTCTTCGYKFEEVLANQLKDQMKSEFDKQLLAKDNEFKDREKKIAVQLKEVADKESKVDQLVADRVNSEKATLQKEIEKKVTGTVKKDYEDQMLKMNEELEAKRKENIGLKKLQLENDKLKNELDLQRIQIETEFEQKKREETKTLTAALKEKYQVEYDLQLRDKDQQLGILREQIEIMKRKSDQGSQQQQGEVLENYVQEILEEAHPLDRIEEIRKGQYGADILQVVINTAGNECGRILYECKRTKAFKDEWMDKLKSDALESKADLKVLVTEVLPDDKQKISIVDGICICKHHDVKGVSALLRDRLLQIAFINSSEINKGEKKEMLYKYLFSEEFKMQLTGIVEGFSELQESYFDEKRKMLALWKQREKQLEKIILGTTSFYGAIKGIAGANAPRIEMLESPKLMIELTDNREPKRKSKKKELPEPDFDNSN